jgi:L-alanine-DL-glutamate epimerase-like enolase superfamily enzyme
VTPEVTVARFSLDLRFPRSSGTGRESGRALVRLSIGPPGGPEALGEASPMPGHSPDTADACFEALQEHRRDLGDLALARTMPQESAARLQRWFERLPAARAAAEFALAGYAALQSETPVSEIYGGGRRAAVPVNTVLPLRDLPPRSEELQRVLRLGIKTFKLKAEDSLEANLENFRMLQPLLPAGAVFRFDPNGRWDEDETRRHAEAFREEEIEYFEQPAMETDPGGCAALRKSLPISLALDESVNSLAELKRYLDAGAADFYILKPTVLGGILATLEAARLVRRAGAAFVVTSALEGAVGRRMCFEAACLVPGPLRACGLDTARFLAGKDRGDGLQIAGGVMSAAPQTAGEKL